MGRRILIPVAVKVTGHRAVGGGCRCKCTKSIDLNVLGRNPWAICHKLKAKNKKAYEKCIKAIKRQEGIRK